MTLLREDKEKESLERTASRSERATFTSHVRVFDELLCEVRLRSREDSLEVSDSAT